LRKAFLLALLLATPAFAADPAATIYSGVTLIDGTGAPPRERMAIVVGDGHIEKIVPMTQLAALRAQANYKTAQIVDLHGDYALPGLIDSHVHLATDPDPAYERAILRRDIYSGVTTVRDMAGDTRVLSDLARSTLLNKIEGPNIYYAALMAGPQFFHDPRTIAAAQGATPGAVPWMQAMTDDTDIPLAVARAQGTGATALKLYADMPAPLVTKITAEAHRQHMLVWVHAAIFPARPLEEADAGVDVMSHACMLAYQVSDAMPPEYHHRASVQEEKFANGTAPLDPLFAQMKSRGIILDATLYVYDAMWRERGTGPAPYCTLALAQKIAGAAHSAGIDISTGTDDDGDWHALYPSLFDEIGLLVHTAGFTSLEAIRAATLIGARTVGREKEMGTLQTGKRANMVFLAKNPLADIANLRSVVLTVKDGAQYWRTKYQPITADEAKSAQ